MSPSRGGALVVCAGGGRFGRRWAGGRVDEDAGTDAAGACSNTTNGADVAADAGASIAGWSVAGNVDGSAATPATATPATR